MKFSPRLCQRCGSRLTPEEKRESIERERALCEHCAAMIEPEAAEREAEQ